MGVFDEISHDAEAWYHAEGDGIYGTVLSIGVGTGDYGAHPIITIRVKEGENSTETPENGDSQTIEPGDIRAWFVFGMVANGKVAESAPQVGDVVAAKYLGTKETRDGKQEYKKYGFAVVERGPGGGFDWGRFGGTSPSTPVASASAPAPESAFDPGPEAGTADDDIPF